MANKKIKSSSLLPITLRLVLASALMLFLELALIRWTGSNIVHLSYFTNFVLLGSFLGIGLGFLRAGKAKTFPFYSPITLALLVSFILFTPVVVDRGTDQTVIYFTSLTLTGPPVWVVLPIIFLSVAVILAGPAELVGRCFHHLPRLKAYRYDLIGSLLGIASFTALSYLGAPPIWWGIITALLFCVLLPIPRSRFARATVVILVLAPLLWLIFLLNTESAMNNVRWSPYYKIKTDALVQNTVPILEISVNGIPHQQAVPAEYRLNVEPQYGLPYQRAALSKASDVLIIGAGSGSDVAIALRNGANHVDAVEIDPVLLDIGRKYHPDRPYQDSRVSTHIDDGRAFLSRTDRKYDLILFALPDSLTLVQGASSLRLESYLFTKEAFQSAHDHLKPGGAFSMYNYYRETWLIDRLALTATQVFGHKPCVDQVGDQLRQAVITSGLSSADQRCETMWTGSQASTPQPATDDHPFVYLFTNTIPTLYLITVGLILAVSLIMIKLVGTSYRRMYPYADLFLLGTGFLLLETKSITSFALLFGTTWVVNAIVFAGVLLAVLAAVEITQYFKTPSLKVMYGLLFVGLLLSFLVSESWLLTMSVPLRVVVAVVIAFLPIFAANIVFAKRFATTADPTTAFGANLLGAMVGGCLEYLSLVTGFDGLLIIAGLVYLGAFFLMPRGSGHVS
jgi:SAM-dependent methyltransferase